MDIPSSYNSPMNSHPTTPLPSQPGTTNPSPSTSVSTSLINKPGTPHVFGGGSSRRRVPASGLSDRTRRALDGIRSFLGSKSCYDILPESFRLIVLDNKLAITKSLQALVTNGVVSAPLYDSTTQRFAGMFTLADVVHLIQYYYLTANEYDNVVAEVEAFQLGSLRKIEQAIDVPPPPTISVHPDQPLSDACAALVRTHARRLPLVDKDDQTGKETIVSVLTQYRVLKFIAINCAHDCARLDQSIGSLGIGTYAAWYEPPTHPANLTSSPPESNSPEPLSPISPLSDAKSPERVLSGPNSLPDDPTSSASGTRSRTSSQDQPESGRRITTDLPLPSSDRPQEDSGADTPTTARRPEFPLSDSPTREDSDKSQIEPNPSSSMGVSDRFFPLSTATMKTSVFDVVHIFSERGISAVPIVDEDGIVLNMYETVDIVDLVRQNAYQVLDSTIEDAFNQRSPDFTGVMTCTPNDTLSSVLTYVRERRCHRFVIVEPEDVPAGVDGRPARKKGSLVGILSLSDMLRFLVGHENLKGMEVPGLGVHGLRGVSNPSHVNQSSALETDVDLTDAASSAGGSKMGSRRGSEATVDSSFSIEGVPGSSLVAQPSQSVPGPNEGGLEDVIEGQAIP
ncbi:AMP-activated serine/threonine-protein kinase regulatory subunit SNF4 [Sporobolomyces salmoneus]|uniref:AMP-activated serine/threonine-protein kinase regulatory subunit SNF4 n=1 Tax=Sporobolomyces salmoneus TaxID=183962 RepID=UPI00317009A3